MNWLVDIFCLFGLCSVACLIGLWVYVVLPDTKKPVEPKPPIIPKDQRMDDPRDYYLGNTWLYHVMQLDERKKYAKKSAWRKDDRR